MTVNICSLLTQLVYKTRLSQSLSFEYFNSCNARWDTNAFRTGKVDRIQCNENESSLTTSQRCYL